MDGDAVVCSGTAADLAVWYAVSHKDGIKIRSNVSRKYQDRGRGPNPGTPHGEEWKQACAWMASASREGVRQKPLNGAEQETTADELQPHAAETGW